MISKKEFTDRLYDNVHAIRIEDDTYGERTRSADPDDEWDRDDTHTSHVIRGFHAEPEEGARFTDLWVPYEPEYGVDYYLLYVVYSTGDSFGHDSGEGIEIIGLYTKDELDVARENRKRIEDHDNAKDQDFHVDLLTPSGQTFQQHTPWIGYFESIDYIELEAVKRLP